MSRITVELLGRLQVEGLAFCIRKGGLHLQQEASGSLLRFVLFRSAVDSPEFLLYLVPDAVSIRLVVVGLPVLIRDVVQSQHPIGTLDSFLVVLKPVQLKLVHNVFGH